MMIHSFDEKTKRLVTDHLSSEGLLSRFQDDLVLPGFCDVHVHFREPGFSYKETIASGSRAAARGGYTAVCTMPNLDPVPDSREHLKAQTDLIDRDAVIRVYPYGAITVGEKGEEFSDLEGLAPSVIAFSDDGKGVQREEMMEEAMLRAKKLGKIIAAHCEVNDLVNGGCIHDGDFARKNGFRGIPSESEYREIERDLALAKKTGCAYHVCHVSTKEGVALIRKAKKEGVDVTCETAPHYLLLCDGDLRDEGKFKMNPPVRSREDRASLIEGILDGTVDMIATDHAPHTAEEKSKGLEKSLMGIVGLETAFPLLYTHLVKTGVLTLDRLIELLSVNPKKRFGIETGADFTVFDPNVSYRIDPGDFLSKGKSTPFEYSTVSGLCRMTVCRGKTVYRNF